MNDQKGVDLNEKFVLFYESFRASELIKRGENPHDDHEKKAFDEMMLSENYDTYFLQRVDFYGYITEALRFETEPLDKRTDRFDSLDWMTDEDEKEHDRITEADRILNESFVDFYASFRRCVLLREGLDADDVQALQDFDDAMICDAPISSYRKDFYSYMCDSLLVMLTSSK